MKLSILTLIASCLVSAPASAGTWSCATGAQGKIIYQAVLNGDDQGHMLSPAKISVAGIVAGSMKVYDDQKAADELTRLIIGAEAPQGANRLRILAVPLQPNVYRAYSLLIHFPIKQEFEGTCTYAP